ncbi:MAG: hypothetical protein H6582_08110 [Crocinitomicaceae bacterium]|nr:hypothetical protein [Crocinitomicaceae bacterium]
MDILQTYYTSSLEIKLRSDGIIEVHSRPEMKERYEDYHMNENVAKIKEVNEKHSLILVFITNGKYSRDARRILSEQFDLAEKVAMIAKTPYQTLVGNFFLGINKPSINIKLFNTQKKAEAWLHSNES